MKLTRARRSMAACVALLHLAMVVLAPLADAQFERTSNEFAALSEVAGPDNPTPTQAPVHQHDNCLFCAAVRAAAEQPLAVQLYAFHSAPDGVLPSTNADVAPQRFLSTSQSRAPPATATA